MRKQFTSFAKRALAFSLALVLLLALVPLEAKADVVVGNWTYRGTSQDNYSWINGSFNTSDADLVYKDNQAYDWSVVIMPRKSPPASAQVVASIKDSSGKTISSYDGTVSMAQHTESTLCTYKDFPELTTSLAGTFTLTVELKLNGSIYAKLVQNFTRQVPVAIESSVTSRSNSDKVFTFADPIDLVLNIKQTSGEATSYNAAVTVTNASGTEVLAARGVSLPASTNITLSVKDLVNLPSITEAGTYKVNLTLTDSKGTIQYQSSADFAVVALAGSVTATVTSATSSNLIFNNALPDVVVNLQKTDGIAETFKTVVTITNSNGSTVFTNAFENNVPATGTATITPNLANVQAVGTYYLTATITDGAGNLRGSTSATFTLTNTNPMTCTLTDQSPRNTGKIYYSGSDVQMRLSITHKASANQTMTIKVIGKLNGKSCEHVATTAKLGSLGTRTVTINGSTLPYGVFEDVCIAVFDANGNELWRSTETFSFSRIPTASNPGDMSILNINDHFIVNTGDPVTKLNLAANAGASMWRSTVRWTYVEKSKGDYSLGSDLQEVMDVTKSNGMKALIILAYNNDNDINPDPDIVELIYGEPYVNLKADFDDPTGNPWLVAYANYCYYVAKMMAQHYPGQVVGFEIWNEWNHATMSKVDATYRTGAHYAMVVRAASAKIRQVNREYGTNFKVIAGATAGDGYGETNSNTFIKDMLAADGFVNAVDGISFHTYSSREITTSRDNPRRFEYISPAEHDFAARIKSFNTMLSQYGASGKEVWITETGWATHEVPEDTTKTSDGKRHITTGVTEQEAAAYLVQLYTWAMADGTLDRIFWYDFMNDINDDTKKWQNNTTESNYGLIHNWSTSGDQPLAYSAKQGYVTMCALSSKLGGATYKGTLSLGSGVYAYQFTKDGKYIAVVWTDGATKTLNVNLAKSITVSDMYGNATTYNGSSAELTISENPIYIEYASGAISSFG